MHCLLLTFLLLWVCMRSHDHILQVTKEVSREGRPVHGYKALPLMASPLTEAASKHAHVLEYESGFSELPVHNEFDVQVHVGLSSCLLMSIRLVQNMYSRHGFSMQPSLDAQEMLKSMVAAYRNRRAAKALCCKCRLCRSLTTAGARCTLRARRGLS